MDTSKLISVMQNCSLFNYITIQITSLNKIEPSKLKQIWIEYIMTSGLTILHVLLFTLIIQQRWTITANIYKTILQKMACPNETLLKCYIVFKFFTTVKHLRTEFDYLFTYLLTYLLTPSSRVLPEKLTCSQLVKFPAFYGTRRFITVETSASHLSLSSARFLRSYQRISSVLRPLWWFVTRYDTRT